MGLPLPKDDLGYTRQEILKICRDRKIHHKTFDKAFGVNTVAVAEDRTPRFYQVDVHRALWSLGHTDGRFYPWD